MEPLSCVKSPADGKLKYFLIFCWSRDLERSESSIMARGVRTGLSIIDLSSNQRAIGILSHLFANYHGSELD